jgi:hypothetical protein
MTRLLALGLLFASAFAARPGPARADSQASSQRFFPLAVTAAQWGGTPLDAGARNRPLTAADRITVRGADFVRAGNDGKWDTADDAPVRFFGVNLSFGANFPPPAKAAALAAELRALGVNLVRLHHLDTRFASGVTNATAAGGDGGQEVPGVLRPGPHPTVVATAVARLRGLIGALSQAGIYVNLNLHVGFRYDAARDGLTSVPRDFRFPAKSKPYQILLPELWDRQAAYACGLVGRLDLAGAPALAMIELNNESTLLDAWQEGLLEPPLPAVAAGLAAGWRTYQGAATAPGAKRPAVPPVSFARGSSEDKVRYARFLTDLDAAYLTAMRDRVQACAGREVPVTGSQMSFGGLANQRSHAAMDYLDTHFYADHYKYPQRSREENWWIRDTSLALTGFHPLPGVALLRDPAKPFAVSEFNQPWPNRYGHEVDFSVAAAGVVQGWGALVHFTYGNDAGLFAPPEERLPAGFTLAGDPARLAAFGQAARLFRERSFGAPALTLKFTEEEALRLAAAKVEQRQMGLTARNLHGLDTGTLMNHRAGSQLVAAAVTEPVVRARVPARGAVAPIRFDTKAQRLTVRDAGVWGESGAVAQNRLGDADLALHFPGDAPAAALIVVSALDDQPVARSRRLLLTVPGPVWRSRRDAKGNLRPELPVRAHRGWTLPSETGKPSAPLHQGEGPVWMERHPAVVSLRLVPGEIAVYPLDGAGRRLSPLPVARRAKSEERVLIDLTTADSRVSPWYEITVK